MAAFISLSNLSWSTPEGRTLFSGLDLVFGPERAGLVGRNGVGKTTLLSLIAGRLAPHAGEVSVQGRVGLLRQTVQFPGTETIADLFGVADALDVLDRAQSGTASVAELADADWTLEARLADALKDVGLDLPATTRLSRLSGGQHTRAALAALMFSRPDFLLLDEPTNNLDREGRRDVIGLLSRWRLGAVVVSHDRELLDKMDAIVELSSLGAKRYGGNWSLFSARKTAELEAARRALADAEHRVAEVAASAQEATERKARRDKAGRSKGSRGDMPRIVAGSRRTRSENSAGDLSRLAERRQAEARRDADTARARIEILQPFALQMASTGLPATRSVVRLERATAEYLPGRPILKNLSLRIVGPERIAVTGPNGAGKSTLLSLVAGHIGPTDGVAWAVHDRVLFDQQARFLQPEASIRDNFLRLNPGSDENACRAALARFMFRAEASLQAVATLSGGQKLRAALACALGIRPPSLLILDEPTNHLDIESVATIQAGLLAYDGALLVVSHDEDFLRTIGITRRLRLAGPPACAIEE